MEKIWLKSYPQGIQHVLEPSTEVLGSMFDKCCVEFSTKKAFTCDKESVSFAKSAELVNNFAASLQSLGVEKGDRVAVIMPNLIQYPIAIFAILKIGAIVVNVNPLYTANEIDYLLEDSGAKVVIALDMMAGKLNELHNKYNVKHVIVTKLPDLYPFLKRTFINVAIKYLKRINISYNYKALDFRELVLSNKNTLRAVNVIPEDIAFIQYTGATTGKPKGAVLLHKNIIANIAQAHAWIIPQMDFPNNRMVVIDALPLYHIFALTANLFVFFFLGGENVMVTNPRDVKGMVKTLHHSKFNVFNGLDTLFSHLLNSSDFIEQKFPYYIYSIAGGMASRESVMQRWREVTGVNVSNCYGLSETSPAVTMNKFDDEIYDGSVGYPIPSTDLEIRDINTHQPVEVGTVGVVWVRGPQVMKEYWHNPEQTNLAFDDNGWLNTKDLGYLSDKGKLFLSGRQSEMIIVSGFNVYAAEVEAVLNHMEEVKEAVVIGLPDENTGEAVVAFIVFKPGLHIQEFDIIKKCKKYLTGYKVPRHIHIVDELPKTLIGKVDKVALAKKFLKNS